MYILPKIGEEYLKVRYDELFGNGNQDKNQKISLLTNQTYLETLPV